MTYNIKTWNFEMHNIKYICISYDDFDQLSFYDQYFDDILDSDIEYLIIDDFYSHKVYMYKDNEYNNHILNIIVDKYKINIIQLQIN